MPTSSARASPARTYPSPGQVPDLPEPVRDSGGKWFEPFAWFDRASQSWRTWQRCLIGEWEPFSETWPRSGMMRNGIAYRRQPLAPLTAETESGLLPTPEASNTKAVALRSAGRSPRNFLAQLPTPRATDGDKGSRTTEGALRELNRGRNLDLGTIARLWPTPTANEDAAGTPNGKMQKMLGNHPEIRGSTPEEWASGQLNPTWVEWLMGFPSGWTDLDA
jgi:hypothetical protein